MVLLVFILIVAIDDRELRANAGPVAPVAPDRITGGSAYVGGDGGALGLPWYYGAVVEGRERRAGVRRVRSARSLGATDHQDSNVGRGGGRGGGGGGGCSHKEKLVDDQGGPEAPSQPSHALAHCLASSRDQAAPRPITGISRHLTDSLTDLKP